MEEQNQERLNDIQALLKLKDIEKMTKKLSKMEVTYSELLQILVQLNHPEGIEILRIYSNNFEHFKGKMLVAIILYLSTSQPNIEAMLLVDKLLTSNQFVGIFVKNYERAILENSPSSQKIIDHILNNKKNVPNFNLVFQKLFYAAKIKGLEHLEELETLINTKKENVLVVDRPLIKIIPLTPRIKQDYLPKYLQIKKGPNAISKQEELREMTKKKVMTKKKLMRELYQDQNQLHKLKKDKIMHQTSKLKEGYKKGLRMLEEQQMELKKLKTMQLNIKRHKNHSTRKGGNKQ